MQGTGNDRGHVERRTMRVPLGAGQFGHPLASCHEMDNAQHVATNVQASQEANRPCTCFLTNLTRLRLPDGRPQSKYTGHFANYFAYASAVKIAASRGAPTSHVFKHLALPVIFQAEAFAKNNAIYMEKGQDKKDSQARCRRAF